MEIKIRNNENIYRANLSTQNVQKNGHFSNNSLKNDVFVKSNIAFTGIHPVEVLTRFEKIGITEYKQFNAQEIDVLRNYILREKEFIQDRNSIIVLGNIVKTNLDKKFPNGYVFGSIGGTPAFVGKVLELQGIDVKYCPISGIGKRLLLGGFEDYVSDLPSGKVSKYNEYLKNINLSNEEIKKSKKTYIFADHTCTGNSLKNFQILLERPEIGIKSDNVHYKSLCQDLILKSQDKSALSLIKFENNYYKLDELMNNYIIGRWYRKIYSHIERLPVKDIDKVQEVITKQPDHFSYKQMQFALIDYFAQKGLLKE